jgi:uncharacterized protein with HEPN domain
MNVRTRALLFDIEESAHTIRQWCVGRAFRDYQADRQFRRAVEREFEIIGEALNRLRATDPAMASVIAELPRIVAFRNRIVHGYDTVDDATVWGIVESHLPAMLLQVQGRREKDGT